MVRSALRTAEQGWALRISERLDPSTTARLLNLLAADEDDEDGDGVQGADTVLGSIKSAPGNVSLDSMMVEIGKLEAVRAVGLPAGLFADVAPKVLDGWRARAAIEAPSHLRRHAQPLRVTLLAALIHQREREITDTLVELLIATVHRIGARAERRVTEELINAFKRVTGRRTSSSPSPKQHWPNPTMRCGRWSSRPCPAGSRRCGSWFMSSGPRVRCIGARSRPR